MNDNPLVSVHMITYNHEKYIAEAIEGVLKQKTTFPFELVIGEDFSTDSTRKICLEYQKRYPNIIKLLQREKNIGMVPNFVDTLKNCKGKYVAFCEGDDYWIDEYKLQKQVEFLENNAKYSGACTDVVVIDETGKEIKLERPEFLTDTDITIEKLLNQPLGYPWIVYTPTLIIRNRIFPFDLLLTYSQFADTPSVFLALLEGPIRFLKCKSSIYRKHSQGFTQTEHSQKQEALYKDHCSLLEDLEKLANSSHLSLIRKKKKCLETVLILYDKTKSLSVKIILFLLLSTYLVAKDRRYLGFFSTSLKSWLYKEHPELYRKLKAMKAFLKLENAKGS
ncbi:MAG: glycosyltransferase [Deltaproteobacteria bacterium]|nr:glycosyltransferase [Deltaproteobacteria bacterium]